MELLVFLLAFAGDDTADDLHGTEDSFFTFDGIRFADDAEAAEANLSAKDVFTDFLAVTVGFGWSIFPRSELGKERCGRGDGGGGRAPGAVGGAHAEFAV